MSKRIIVFLNASKKEQSCYMIKTNKELQVYSALNLVS